MRVPGRNTVRTRATRGRWTLQNATRTAFISAFVALALAACGQTASIGTQAPGEGGDGAGFTKFSDIPMPANNTINLDRSLILGGEAQWTGRLVINSGSSVADMYEFYRREMPNFGWQEVTTVRSANSVLVFQQAARVLTIQIAPSGRLLGGSVVDLTMAPRGTGAQPGVLPQRGAGEAPPAPLQAAPRPAVDAAPLAPRR